MNETINNNLKAQENIISDYIHLYKQIGLHPRVCHYIYNYIGAHSFRISCILDGLIKPKENEIDEINKLIHNLGLIKNKVNDGNFNRKLIKLYDEKKWGSNELVKLLENEKY